jgi:hypothetical protein
LPISYKKHINKAKQNNTGMKCVSEDKYEQTLKRNGDRFMDFIHRPKSKILKIKIHNISEAGSASEML